MRNALAIARKEFRSYFNSPIAYVVIGMFALMYGYFFATMLDYFVRQSMQLSQFGGANPTPLNINQALVRPVFMNLSVVFLLVMPIITMRAYAEEKRSGTIELLLTSPITDVELVLGKFFGSLGLYLCMLSTTLPHFALVYYFGGRPELKALASAYLGLLLMGCCFISVGLFISSLTRNQIVAGMITFTTFLMLWVISWIGSFTGPTVDAVTSYLSIVGHFEDFAKGVVDTSHLVYYLTFVTLGLFLTVKSVDSERWRG